MKKYLYILILTFTFVTNLNATKITDRQVLSEGCKSILNNDLNNANANFVLGYALGYKSALFRELNNYNLHLRKSSDLNKVCSTYLQVSNSLNTPDDKAYFPYFEMTMEFELMLINGYDRLTIEKLRNTNNTTK